MAFLSIFILDILVLLFLVNLVIGILIGIIGIGFQIKNYLDIKKGRIISKIRKIVALIFCIVGSVSFVIVGSLFVLYFVKIK